MYIHTLSYVSEITTTTTTRRLTQACPFFLFASPVKWTPAGSPVQELLSVGEGDDCVLLGGMSRSRSPRPLPRTPTTQLHGDRLWQGPGGGNELHYTAKIRNIPPPRRLVPSTLRWMPGRTLGRHQPPGGQHRCLRCCRRSGFSGAPRSRSSTQCRWSHCFMVEPQMVEQLVDILAPLDFRVAEQVIEVPNIACPPRAARTVLRAPQTAELLVEVPTIISYSSFLQQTLEQNVDIPVRGRGGRNVDLQGFLPGQGPTAPYSSLECISEQIVEHIVDTPVSGGGLQYFRQGQSSSSVAHSPAAWLNPEDEPFQRIFRTFSSEEKSATVTRHMGARVPLRVSSGPSTRVDDDTGETWTLLTDPALGSWWYSSRTRRSQWHPPWER